MMIFYDDYFFDDIGDYNNDDICGDGDYDSNNITVLLLTHLVFAF